MLRGPFVGTALPPADPTRVSSELTLGRRKSALSPEPSSLCVESLPDDPDPRVPSEPPEPPDGPEPPEPPDPPEPPEPPSDPSEPDGLANVTAFPFFEPGCSPSACACWAFVAAMAFIHIAFNQLIMECCDAIDW